MRLPGVRPREILTSPLAWILVATAVLYAPGLGWGLPATDGWDNDGIAPRDFLVGLLETFTSGRFYTYPPVHLAILGVLTAPVTIVGLAKASSFAPPDVVREMLSPAYMTPIAYVARATSLAMGVGIVHALARIGEEIGGKRAGWCVAAVAAGNASLCYYAHTSNLDVPYLFWGCLALLALVRAIARREPRRLRTAMILAVLAVGTKDQAYALFVLAAPAALVTWLALDAWARNNARALFKEVAVAIVLGVALLLVVDAVVFNPSGFRARVHFLVGSASQDFAHYSNDAIGRAYVARDTFMHFARYYPLAFAPLIVAGIAIHVRRHRAIDARARLVAGLVPLLAIVSFTIAFNCVARRTDHRFLLPQYALAAVYGGLALEALVFGIRARALRIVARVGAAAVLALALFGCADVDANLLLDPRYDAEAWLAAHVAEGETIEVHGLNVYLPRLPSNAHVERVGPEPIDSRNPLPGVVEVKDTFENVTARRPRWIVVSEVWVGRFLGEPSDWALHGVVMPTTEIQNRGDHDASGFFRALVEGTRGYRRAHASPWTSKLWPRLDIHASTAREIWVFERIE